MPDRHPRGGKGPVRPARRRRGQKSRSPGRPRDDDVPVGRARRPAPGGRAAGAPARPGGADFRRRAGGSPPTRRGRSPRCWRDTRCGGSWASATTCGSCWPSHVLPDARLAQERRPPAARAARVCAVAAVPDLGRRRRLHLDADRSRHRAQPGEPPAGRVGRPDGELLRHYGPVPLCRQPHREGTAPPQTGLAARAARDLHHGPGRRRHGSAAPAVHLPDRAASCRTACRPTRSSRPPRIPGWPRCRTCSARPRPRAGPRPRSTTPTPGASA